MPHAEYTVTIDRPARDVFDYLADGTHNSEWRTGVLDIKHTNSATGEFGTFWGLEQITWSGEVAYELRYAGGFLG